MPTPIPSPVSGNVAPISFEIVEQNFYADAEQTLLIGKEHLQVAVGQQIYGSLRLKNTGSETWQKNHAAQQIQLLPFASTEPNAFCHASWGTDCQLLGSVAEVGVAPEEVGTLNFILQAPESKGVFYEVFHIQASNSYSQSLDLDILIEVMSVKTAPPPVAILPPATDSEEEAPTDTDDQADEDADDSDQSKPADSDAATSTPLHLSNYGYPAR